MTIAIALKVGDCVVLGADSASTIVGPDGVQKVYFNAEKIFNLAKGLPIGAVTWGIGSFGSRSVTTLAKDLRERFTDPQDKWFLKRDKFKLDEVVARTREFFFENLYAKHAQATEEKDASGKTVKSYPAMGFMIGGYSPGDREGRVFITEADPTTGKCVTTEEFRIGEYGVQVRGQPEAILRLVNGWSPRIYDGLVEAGIKPDEARGFLESTGQVELVHPAMPLQDAIDLVRYLAETTAGFVQFVPGAPTVHPPIDLACISYHEQFRWVKRKHYFAPDLNPPVPVVYEPPSQ
jgi:hypothetical protein